MSLRRHAYSILNYLKFTCFLLCKGAFGQPSPEVVLKILYQFLALEAPFYSEKTVMGRSVQKSIKLLGVLITSYLETRSEITLDQILEVLKREFIQRGSRNNGRKQF